VRRARIEVELSPDVTQMVDELMRKTGDSTTDLLRKALALYKLAVEAKSAGKAVGIATSPELLETEFVGL
jgi:hypothetical protein